ncbi:MAG: hypothetical protein PHN39_04195 [Candidatus Pacebacteria bacterium]|nr:hypothetical protein [Candidatus Paceibacterota bacterium]
MLFGDLGAKGGEMKKRIELHVAASYSRLNGAWAAIWCRTDGCSGHPEKNEANGFQPGQIGLNQWGTLDFNLCPELEILATQEGWKEKDRESGDDFYAFCVAHKGNQELEVEA